MPDLRDPTVSVVIATHGRARLLTETLDALDAQDGPSFEVVVVDDDSPDDTSAMAAARGVKSLRVRRGGPGRARQAGWHAATGSIIAFTDDDCVPTPQWLAELIAPIVRGEADFVQGRTQPRPDQLHLRGPWSRTQRIVSEKGFYETCNIAYRRDVLEQLGGFSPEYEGPFTAGEDCDLGWRARKAGYRSAFAPDALVHHAVWPSSYKERIRNIRRREMIVRVVRDHPEIRDLLYRRYFFRPSHLRTLLAIGGLVAAGAVRRWLPVAVVGMTTVGYVVNTRDRPQPAARRALQFGQIATVQLLELAVFVRSSIRYRTIVL
jgi:GT2 family glycosyltransferase